MEQLIYVLQFRGQVQPVEGSEGVLRAATIAPSCTIRTEVGPGGVRGNLESLGAGTASFESDVVITGETSFQESGTITFGEDNRLRFSTVGEGYLAPSPNGAGSAGAVTWRVEEGEGQFANASGLITSNFSVSETGEVVDNHFGVLYLQS